MYIPKHFEINDENTIYDIMEKNSFATVFSTHKGRPYASHLPLILNREKEEIYGHFARPNPQWSDIEKQEVLIIFQGPHSYISPSWYETATAVPTWNYVSVHVYGEVEILKSDEELIDTLCTMVKTYEEPNSTYNLDNVDSKYIDGLSKGIAGFKIKINSIEGKMKLSQNHPSERQERVIEQLEKVQSENARQIALLMKKNKGVTK
jgi:transcriptional regulator